MDHEPRVLAEARLLVAQAQAGPPPSAADVALVQARLRSFSGHPSTPAALVHRARGAMLVLEVLAAAAPDASDVGIERVAS